MREGLYKINRPLTIAGSDHSLTFEITTNQNKTMANLQSQPEIFKPIFGFEGAYEISTYGRIKSLERNVLKKNGTLHYTISEFIMKAHITWGGYSRISLFKNSKYFKYPIHRLVAIHFIPNPIGYDQINHIDGNKQNNHIENLEWCNASQNHNHRYKTLGHIAPRTGVINDAFSSKPVVQLNLNNELVNIYPSIGEAVRSGYNRGHVSECCNGKRKTHKNSKWQYYEVD